MPPNKKRSPTAALMCNQGVYIFGYALVHQPFIFLSGYHEAYGS